MVCLRLGTNAASCFVIEEFKIPLRKQERPTLLSKKYIFTKQELSPSWFLLPMFDDFDNQIIIGFQIIDKRNKNQPLSFENFKSYDYQFRTEIASTGYKIITVGNAYDSLLPVDQNSIEIDCRLNPNLTKELGYTESNKVIHIMTKALLNVIPKKWSA